LGENIDWLFREAVKDLANRALVARAAAYEKQRAPYEGLGFPQPGEDAELVAIIKDGLGTWMSTEPPDDEFRRLTRRISTYMSQENKRRNLVGEGFEDVIAAVVTRLPSSAVMDLRIRAPLHDLPGFRSPPQNEKPKKVDLALVQDKKRTLVSSKWSIRADREEQFHSDFEAYARLEAWGQDFGYALITNEFDAARLKAACERRRQNAFLFTDVVHMCPDALLATYGATESDSVTAVRSHIESGRLMSLQTWLQQL
jgi:hypothetical protein